MKALGLTDEDLAFDVNVYPENWQTVQVFFALRTQWNQGMGGCTGLRYEAIPLVEKRLGVKKKRHAEIFHGLQIMEAEALNAWREEQEEEKT